MHDRHAARRPGRPALSTPSGSAGRHHPRVLPLAVSVLILAAAQSVVSGDRASAGTGGAILGAYVGGGNVETDIKAAITGFETKLGRKLGIDHHFYPWTTAFPTWRESWDVSGGRIPMDTWGHHSTSKINSGSDDAMIRQRADGLKAVGHRVLLRWFAEMDGQFWATELGSASAFIAAWRRIYNIFQARGATNVKFVWCPNASAFAQGKAQSLYPGDAYVDWICADSFNWSPKVPGGGCCGTWRNFSDMFTSFYAWASTRGKPLLIGETGAQEDPNNATHKASWITGMRNYIESRPAIKALVYFDAISTSNQGGTFDWRANTSNASMTAFKAMAQDPYFN